MKSTRASLVSGAVLALALVSLPACTKKESAAPALSLDQMLGDSLQPRMNLISMSTEMPALDMKSRVDVFYAVEILKKLDGGKYSVQVPFFHQSAALSRPRAGTDAPGESIGTGLGAGIPLTIQLVGDKAKIVEGLDAWLAALAKASAHEPKLAKLADYFKTDDMLANLVASALGFQRAFLQGRPAGAREWEFAGNPMLNSFAKLEGGGKMKVRQTKDDPEEYAFDLPETKIDKVDAQDGTHLVGSAITTGGIRFDAKASRQEFALITVSKGTIKRTSDGQTASADSSTQMLVATQIDPKCTVRFLKPDIHALVMRAFFDQGYRLAYAETKDDITLDYVVKPNRLVYVLAQGGKKREFAEKTGESLLPAIEKFAAAVPKCADLSAFFGKKR